MGGQPLVGPPGAGQPLTHIEINPDCHKCHGTGFNEKKHKACRKCACRKCDGTGWNIKKNRACEKFKKHII